MRVNPAVIWTTIVVLMMGAAIGLDNIGNGMMAFGAYLWGLSTDFAIPRSPKEKGQR